MNATDDPDTARRIRINTAAIVDNINKTERGYASSIIDDFLEDLARAIHEYDALDILDKWDKRKV